MVEMAMKRGIAVWLDVEGPGETPELWDQTMRKGVQGMQTDHPEALTEYLIKSHLRDGVSGLETGRFNVTLPTQ